MSPRFFIYEHQDKGVPFITALERGGWVRVRNLGEADIIFADLEGWGRTQFLEQQFFDRGVPTVLYPHGGLSSCLWNFPGVKTFPFVAAVFVPASGHSRILSSYDCPYRSVVTGFPYGGPTPFRGGVVVTDKPRVLFAPIHPNSNGYLSNVDREVNARAYHRLLTLQHMGHIASPLTVRHVGELSDNGLWKEFNVSYNLAVPSQNDSVLEVANFDLVVSHGTFLANAVSQGVPAIGMGEWIAPHYGGSDKQLSYVSDWHKYKDIMAFPLDIIAEVDSKFLIERALYSDYEISEWKSNIIGGPFDPNTVLSFVEELYAKTNQKSKQYSVA